MFFIPSLKGAAHPFYVSLTEIHLKPEKNTAQMSIRVFADDLESALRKLTGFNGHIETAEDSALFMQQISAYFDKRVQIRVNGFHLNFTLLGYEHEENAIWVYFESPLDKNPVEVDINMSILYDFLPGQSNLVHVLWQDQRKSFKLDFPERKYLVRF